MDPKPKKIFIVDDEALIAFEMADALEDCGFDVVGPSTHLDAALDVAEQEDIDVACLDVNLGSGKTSEPIARILKERKIPYVYITAYDANQIAFVEPDDTVINKPISITDLRKALIDAAGIAKLFAPGCEVLVKTSSCRHFGGVISPEPEGIVAGVAV